MSNGREPRKDRSRKLNFKNVNCKKWCYECVCRPVANKLQLFDIASLLSLNLALSCTIVHVPMVMADNVAKAGFHLKPASWYSFSLANEGNRIFHRLTGFLYWYGFHVTNSIVVVEVITF